MTDQNNAAQAIQEAERIAAADDYFKARTWLMDTTDNRRIFEAGFDRAYALLSKLRAPVADERVCICPPNDENGALCHKDCPIHGMASAPVAGEATVYLDAGHLREVLAGNDMPVSASAEPGHGMVPLHAAPQASEAVRILFPTHLRKMWSGGEVQSWLDEHQGVTAQTPSAKGSLERYRAWQAEQAAAPCSCPRGDGSLRHPCAVHGGDHFRDATQMVGASEAVPQAVIDALKGWTGSEPSQSVLARAVDAWLDPGAVWESERTHADRAALSAQPGAQKNCNCATCRPHSVEMRMILCEVCGDKRCPHAADHRNECKSHPKQHNDGGADA